MRIKRHSENAQFSRVEEEYALARKYLEVEKARFGDRMEYRFEAAPDALRALVPSLMLQPLVENCVQHAVSVKLGPTRIQVLAEKVGERLHLTVRDDGPGLPAARREGIGLSNTRTRLAVLYPGAHQFCVRDAEGGGVEAAMVIPYRAT